MNSGNNCGLEEKEDEGTSSKRTNRAGSGSSQNVKKEIPSNQGDVEMVESVDIKPSWFKMEGTSSLPFSSDKSIKGHNFSSNLKSDEDEAANRISCMKTFIDELYARMDDRDWGHFVDYVLQKKGRWKKEQSEVVVIPKVKEEKEELMECCLDDAIPTPDSEDLNESHPQIPDNKTPDQIPPCRKRKPPRKMKNLTPSKISRKDHNCSKCMKCFSSMGSLTKHRLVHLTPEEKAKVKEGWKHSCYFCAKLYQTPSQLEVHLLVHTGEKPFSCEQCGQQFTRNSDLTRHKAFHTINPKQFSCDQCSKCFTQKGSLKTHEKRAHLKLKNVPCPECDQKLSTKGNMKKHMNEIHRRVRHPCPHCHKTFSQKGYLGLHVKKVHPKPFIINNDSNY